MVELQENKPKHNFYINKVGITELFLPLKIKFKRRMNLVQSKMSSFVSLGIDKRGAHISRLVRILTEFSSKPVDFEKLEEVLDRIKKELKSNHSYLQIEFNLLDVKESPVTKNKGYVNYRCFIEAEKARIMKLTIGTKGVVTTLCPISKEISKYNAHNQRGEILVKVLCKDNKIWFDEIISIIEKSGSAEIYSILKRLDEKFVTEEAYNNPKIAEDIVREIAFNLTKNNSILEAHISCKNLESIHLHNVYAEVKLKNV